MNTIETAIEAIRAVVEDENIALTAEDRNDLSYTVGLLLEYRPVSV